MIFWWLLSARTRSHFVRVRSICSESGGDELKLNTEDAAKRVWLEKNDKAALTAEERAKYEWLSRQALPKTKSNEEIAKRAWLRKR